MRAKPSVVLALVLAGAAALPAVGGKKKNQGERAMLEKMESIPCGAKERGVMGIGAVWASVGITHVNSNEKLCQQYLVRSDETEYQIRPTDKNHPPVLPVGQEIEFKVKKDRMIVHVPDGHGTREFIVVAMQPTNANSDDPNKRASNY